MTIAATRETPPPGSRHSFVRGVFFVAAVTVGAAVNLAMAGCKSAIVYPSCGDWRQRPTDGATCQECVERDGGTFFQCRKRVYLNGGN